MDTVGSARVRPRGASAPSVSKSRHRSFRFAFTVLAVAVVAAVSPFASAEPAQAATLRCTPASYYVDLSVVPPSARAANQGCIYRKPIKASYATAASWRGVGAQHCLNIWKGSVEYQRWMTWQQKYAVMPAWCSYHAASFLWWY